MTALTSARLLLTHPFPIVSSVLALRRSLLPRLAGIGEADHVALTFDDGPDRSSTPAFLEELAHLEVKATFFVLGSMVKSHPGLLEEIVAEGHEVGLHGYSHRSHLRSLPRTTRADLRAGYDSITDAIGKSPVWFRPPYGILSASSLHAARELGLRTVLWTAWGKDWAPKATPESVMRNLRRGLAGGGTVLLHDSDCTSAPQSWRSALGVLPMLVEECASSGLAIGPLGEHHIPAVRSRA